MTRYHIDTFLSGDICPLIGKLSGAHLLALLCCLFQEIRAVSQSLEDQMAHATCQPVTERGAAGQPGLAGNSPPPRGVRDGFSRVTPRCQRGCFQSKFKESLKNCLLEAAGVNFQEVLAAGRFLSADSRRGLRQPRGKDAGPGRGGSGAVLGLVIRQHGKIKTACKPASVLCFRGWAGGPSQEQPLPTPEIRDLCEGRRRAA
ncbi:PREDICTED: uncharacterized protein LOC104286932 [Charadrius vociferus]|uniref:uncharacterized protein LOC104286932 n=1 Tax=Charadrius vociferus TaxID=50402 RepID=UPI000521CE73|nr:PREDICTED: uncharacterized protein LOC104286932 [Charadrius vociferus]